MSRIASYGSPGGGEWFSFDQAARKDADRGGVDQGSAGRGDPEGLGESLGDTDGSGAAGPGGSGPERSSGDDAEPHSTRAGHAHPGAHAPPLARHRPVRAAPMAHRHAMPLPRDLVEEIAEIGIRRRLPAHTIATHEGDPGETFCVLLRGSARLSLDGEDGRSVDLGTLHPGDYFGEMMIDGGGRAATVLTLEPCEVIAISRRQFGELLASRPDFAKHVMLKLAARVRTLARLVKQLALMDVDGRVRALLLELAEQEGVDLVVRPAPSQQAIADRVGASRSMINRVMKRLGAEGFVRAAGDRLILRR